jgi:DNA-binding transcriptional LysR family regulator
MCFTLKQLEAFCTLAQCMSYSGASKTLGISQSAMSRAIQSLEIELGASLFERSTRSIELAAHGRRLLPIKES